MLRTIVFATAIVTGAILVPVATMGALATPPAHVATTATALPPVPLFIVWTLIALIAIGISFSVWRILRRSESDTSTYR